VSKLAEKVAAADEKLAKVEKVAVATHSLVNGNMLAQLQLNADTTAKLAKLTGSDEDVAVASAAKKKFEEYRDRDAAAAATIPDPLKS
jgi:chaperone required for assembly of F1-ATPase